MVELSIRVHAGQRRIALRWDPWRAEWVVSCPAEAVGGAANREVLRLLAEWIGVPSGSVHLQVGSRSSSKVVRVHGATKAEVDQRLRTRSERMGATHPT